MSYWLNFCQDSNNFNTIDNRANFFAASNQYEKNLGVGARQFGGADKVSRAKDGILSADDYNRIVRDSTNAGTYNYYGPKQDGLGHKRYDVDPYIDFGNGLGDITSLEDRKSVPMSKKVFGININVGPSKMIFGKLPSKTSHPKTMGANRITNNAERSFNASQDFCENNKEACNEKQ